MGLHGQQVQEAWPLQERGGGSGIPPGGLRGLVPSPPSLAFQCPSPSPAGKGSPQLSPLPQVPGGKSESDF